MKMVWEMDGRRSCLQFNPYRTDIKQKEQTYIFSPFRIYLDFRAKANRELLLPGMRTYGGMRLSIHEYDTPYEIRKGKTKNDVLYRRFAVEPGVKHKYYMDHHEVMYP